MGFKFQPQLAPICTPAPVADISNRSRARSKPVGPRFFSGHHSLQPTPTDLSQQLKWKPFAIPSTSDGKLPKIFKQEERESDMIRCLWVVGCCFFLFQIYDPNYV